VGFDTTGQLLIIYSVFFKYLRIKLEYNKVVHQLFVDFKKACDSVRREVLYNILIEFAIPLKLVRLIKMCLNETYSRVQVGRNDAIRWVQANQKGSKLNSTHMLLVYAGDVNIMCGSICTIKKNTKTLIVTSTEIGLEVNAEKTKYMVTSRDQHTGQNNDKDR
jgi:hypothetical protein